MPTTPHIEKHFTASETVRDIVIGMADGLTVPFALAAGLSAAVSSIKIIATAGMAEIAVAGAIPMGLGGYLAARTDQKHYDSEERREFAEVEGLREREVAEVDAIFKQYGLVDPKRAPISAATIGTSYLVGGLISAGAIPSLIASMWHSRLLWS